MKLTPNVRLILRAGVVFAATTLEQLRDSSTWTTALVTGAVIGGILAGLEVLTPINGLVGLGKDSDLASSA